MMSEGVANDTGTLRRRVMVLSVALLLVGAIASLVAFGIVGIGRGSAAQFDLNFDGRVLFAAGRAWLHGTNPYDFPQLAAAVDGIPAADVSVLRFLYPPQASAICMALGLFDYQIARQVWLALNLSAIAVIVILIAAHLRREQPRQWRLGAAILAAVAIGNPFCAHVVWMGQTTLVAFAALFAAWWLVDRGQWLLGGLCLGLATFKPQICFLVIFWLLLERRWRVLAVAAATAFVLALRPILLQGPIGALLAWKAGVSGNYALPSNLPDFPHKIGVESVLYLLGVHIPTVSFAVLAAIAAVALWRVRARLEAIDVFALLMVITLSFTSYLHDYDYVALLPTVIPFWRLAIRSRAFAIGGLTLLALMVIPERIVMMSGIAMLAQWRTVLVLVLGGCILLGAVMITGRKLPPATALASRPH